MRFCVQREGAAHLRDRLALRLLRNQYTAATADQLMVMLPQFAKAYFRRNGGIRRGLRTGVMPEPVPSQIATSMRPCQLSEDQRHFCQRSPSPRCAISLSRNVRSTSVMASMARISRRCFSLPPSR